MAEYQWYLPDLEQQGLSVYAVSSDDEAHARDTAERLKLSYPVLYGVPPKETAETWGAYWEERRGILHATAFILGPDGTVRSATYSTGPVGRLSAYDAIRFTRTRQRQ